MPDFLANPNGSTTLPFGSFLSWYAMALHLLDGFETYGNGGIAGASLDAALGQIWSAPGATNGTDAYITTPGRGNAGACLHMPDDGYNYLYHNCGVSKQTWIIGFAIYTPKGAVNNGSNYIYQARDSVDGYQMTLRLGYLDSLQMWFGYWGGGAYFHQESNPLTFRTGQWNYVEIKYTIHDSTGSYEVRVNGVNVLSASGIDTDFTNVGDVERHIFVCAVNNQKFDDIYICDDSGAEFNDWLGDQYTVIGIVPGGDTAQLDWSAQPAGSHYQNIDEDGGNDNNDYVYDSTLGNEDLYDYDNLPVSPSDILLLDIWTQAALDIVGSESLIVTCQSGVTHSDGPTETVTDTNYTTFHRLLSQDPNTAAAWTEAGLNAAQFGVKVG